MTGKQWGSWSRSGRANGWDGKDKKPKGGQPKDTKGFPAYDSSSTPSSSATSSRPFEQEKEQQLKTALKELIEQNQLAVPPRLQQYMKEDAGSSLKQDQKALNTKRKLIQRLERLKGAQSKKDEQWLTFKQEMKEHVAREKTRYDTESQELATAIKETQTQLDKAMSGAPSTPHETDTEAANVDAEEIFQDIDKDMETRTDREKDMEAAVKQAQAGQMMLAQQMSALQDQISYMASMMIPPQILSPTRQAMDGSMQPPMTPKHDVGKRRATEPFARPHMPTGPYATPDKTKARDAINLEGMDGYGPV